MDDLILVLEDSTPIGLVMEDDSPLTLTIGNGETEYPIYDGETEFTPSSSVQTIFTARKLLATDITINPIPSNYGLVTYDGSIITIS